MPKNLKPTDKTKLNEAINNEFFEHYDYELSKVQGKYADLMMNSFTEVQSTVYEHYKEAENRWNKFDQENYERLRKFNFE